MHRLLLIDDDEDLFAPLRDYLARFDLRLSAAIEPADGLDRLQREAFDLVILDVMLPGMDGFEVLRRIRRAGDLPVLMLSARGEVTDRIVGMEIGADDYLPKPFEPRELVVRIQSILRRAHPAHPARAPMEFEGLRIDPRQHSVSVAGRPAPLTDMEFRLLLLLASSPGEPFSRDRILNALKGIDADLYTRSVDILISRLRQKLRPLEVIHTHRGSGYSFSAAPTNAAGDVA